MVKKKNNGGRPKGLLPFKEKHGHPVFRDKNHQKHRHEKQLKVETLRDLIKSLKAHEPVDFDYLRGVTRRFRAAQNQLKAMRP